MNNIVKLLTFMVLSCSGSVTQSIEETKAKPIYLYCTEWRTGYYLSDGIPTEFIWCNQWLEIRSDRL